MEPGDRGFTLLEALCALAVMSFALVALLQSFNGGMRGITRLDKELTARVLAKSLLAEERAAVEAQAEFRSGQSHGQTWSVEVAPATEEWARPAPGDRWRLYRVDIAVLWPPAGRLALRSYKLGANP
ncbi:hypothetical protein BH10PSE7_BH10PSE7_05870 [soil metagenome]